MLDRALIGRTSPPLTVDVERGHIQRFAEAIGDPNPIYRDEAAARAAGYPTIVAPPTFAIALRPNDVREGLGIDMKKVLHGEQHFELARALRAGDRLTLTQRIADVYEKQGRSGAMTFLILETKATQADGAVVYTSTATIVVRQ